MAKKAANKATEELVKPAESDWVEVTPPFLLHVAGKKYLPNTKYTVDVALGQTILHMSELKRNAELAIHVGKKFEIKRLMTPTGYKVVRKVVGNVTG